MINAVNQFEFATSRYKHNPLFVTRLPTMRRPKPNPLVSTTSAISGFFHETDVPSNGIGANRHKIAQEHSRNSSGNLALLKHNALKIMT